MKNSKERKVIISFERRKLVGPQGIKLIGPEEHRGESRYSWIRKLPAGSRKALYIRIEKLPGYTNEADPYSPIVQFCFTEDGLSICVCGPNAVPGHINSIINGVMNPYLNEVVHYYPRIIIPLELSLEMLWHDVSYEISTESNFRGDFLILTGKYKGRTDVIVINISAIGLFQGLDKITMDGSFIYEGKMIGKLTGEQIQKCPIWRRMTMESAMSEIAETESLQACSYLGVRCLMEKRENGSLVLQDFLHNDMSVNSDRPSSTPEKGVRQAKEIFSKLFGS